MKRHRIIILGSTGSIGRSALDVVRSYPEVFEVVGLAANSNVELLAAQVNEFSPAHVVVVDEDAAAKYGQLGLSVACVSGLAALDDLAAVEVDIVLCAVVGAIGLHSLLSAIDAGNRVAVANKEPFVMAGQLIMARARAKGVEVLPVDSEHNAIFQCLQGAAPEAVQCIHLTASGGPFYGCARDTLHAIAPAEATNHPTWDMGAKISVDSATLMNKGLEIIEAMWLFDLPAEKIEVVVHPQSIVHSLVEFTDGHILAHLGVTDMKFPILFALTYPERVSTPMARLDLTTMKDLTFATPDFDDFPCLGYAREAAAQGGTAPAILNAANEEAVHAFCREEIPFLAISDVVGEVRQQCVGRAATDLETILSADRDARVRALEVIHTLGTVKT